MRRWWCHSQNWWLKTPGTFEAMTWSFTEATGLPAGLSVLAFLKASKRALKNASKFKELHGSPVTTN